MVPYSPVMGKNLVLLCFEPVLEKNLVPKELVPLTASLQLEMLKGTRPWGLLLASQSVLVWWALLLLEFVWVIASLDSGCSLWDLLLGRNCQ